MLGITYMQHIGIDIVEIGRIRTAVSRWGERFLRRVYTEAELDLCKNQAQRLASRFAGKEAVMKALGAGNDRISWRDIEILSDESHRPMLFLHGRALSLAQELGVSDLAVSLSHSVEYAVASAIGGSA
ncbi:holo-ACP synthase [Chloroflexota bacterium]